MPSPSDPTTIERLPKSRVKATVKIEEAEHAAAEKEALQRLAEKVNIKGFRPGHAPPEMIRARFSPEEVLEETVRRLIARLLPDILAKHALAPVLPPKVEVTARLPLTLAITFIEEPAVKMKDAEHLTVPKKEVTVDEKDLQRVIDGLLHDHRTKTSVDRASKEGDEMTIDFRVTDEAQKEVPGLTAAGEEVVLGSKMMLPGFEEQLIGLKAGEQKSFTLTLPEKFPMEHLKGKSVTFHVTVRKVEEVSLPALTDAFAKEKLRAESAKDVRNRIEASLKAQEERWARMERERSLLEEIRKHTQVDLADELIDAEVRSIVEEWSRELEQKGSSIMEYMKKEKKTPEQLETELKAQAAERWKLRLGLKHLMAVRAITVSDPELEPAFQAFLAGLPADQRGGAENEWKDRGSLYQQIRWKALVEKTIEALLKE